MLRNVLRASGSLKLAPGACALQIGVLIERHKFRLQVASAVWHLSLL